MDIGFNNKKYFKAQTHAILERVKNFNKLYLEFGGRLTFDGHASRVLPGYDPLNKIQLLKKLGKNVGVLYCINSKVVQKGTRWSDTGLTLEELALKEINILEDHNIDVIGIVATEFSGQKKVVAFKNKLESLGKKLYTTSYIEGYPKNIKNIFGKKGFPIQPLIPTNKKLIVVTGAGANSGKMFVCLSQIYHNEKIGIEAGFAKFETFPIWDLPLNHPINIAYEAATADIGDMNMVDPFHLNAHNIVAINYNRDIENFAILKNIMQKICGKTNFTHTYKSPTNMGVNMASKGIINDIVCQSAAREEVFRRYDFYKNNFKGMKKTQTLKRMNQIIKKIT